MLTVERAVPHDAAGIYEVMRATWIATYPVPPLGISEDDIRAIVESNPAGRIERWRQAIERPEHTILVARERHHVVGYVAPFFDETAAQQRLGALYVLPEFQGKGWGGALLAAALDAIGRDRDIYLHVASFNVSAIDFYRHFGFEETGVDTSGSTITRSGVVVPELEMVRRAATS